MREAEEQASLRASLPPSVSAGPSHAASASSRHVSASSLRADIDAARQGAPEPTYAASSASAPQPERPPEPRGAQCSSFGEVGCGDRLIETDGLTTKRKQSAAQ